MASLADLIAQRQALDQKIANLQGEARNEAIAKVRSLMAEHGLTAADLAGKVSRPTVDNSEKKAVAVKYRDKAGNSWTGRGLKPKWLVAALESGKSIEEFAI